MEIRTIDPFFTRRSGEKQATDRRDLSWYEYRYGTPTKTRPDNKRVDRRKRFKSFVPSWKGQRTRWIDCVCANEKRMANIPSGRRGTGSSLPPGLITFYALNFLVDSPFLQFFPSLFLWRAVFSRETRTSIGTRSLEIIGTTRSITRKASGGEWFYCVSVMRKELDSPLNFIQLGYR